MSEPREIGLRVRHANEPPSPNDGYRVLVDRLWPRGHSKEDLQLDAWEKDLAPSDALRRWFGHDADRWQEFVRRYREELSAPNADARLDDLARRASIGPVTLVYAAQDPAHNNALVLLQAILPRLMDAFAEPPRRAA
ncbi:DUF488 domain-containing protein [Polyangium aurulentum]|uniref:DUF488 domain-containing protein n=1 Tax=Polyangium aurulentum TaxID=2567896 RepID=UPI0010AEE7D2|nr:DUF488 family protein [Polyangium aurulentum]UQA55572.1 DUF488 family protein [Polyangium aurulentum]